MQLQPILADGTKKYPNMIQGAIILGREEGVRKGIYRGLSASLVRESIYSTTRLGLYDPVKRFIGVTPESSNIWKFVSGGCVGLIASALCNPADFLKVRMQAYVGAPMSLSWHLKTVY